MTFLTNISHQILSILGSFFVKVIYRMCWDSLTWLLRCLDVSSKGGLDISHYLGFCSKGGLEILRSLGLNPTSCPDYWGVSLSVPRVYLRYCSLLVSVSRLNLKYCVSWSWSDFLPRLSRCLDVCSKGGLKIFNVLVFVLRVDLRYWGVLFLVRLHAQIIEVSRYLFQGWT